MSEINLNELLVSLKAAGEETRLRILALFRSGDLTVTELVSVLRQSQPRVSRHLRLLCEAGLLEKGREGTWIFYRLAGKGGAGNIARSVIDFLPMNDQILQNDQLRLAEIKKERKEKAESYFSLNAHHWDKIRSLYVAEEEVEKNLLDITSDINIDDFLDVGTGTGRMLDVFAPHIKHGIGVDLSREMLTVARVNLENSTHKHCQVRHGDMYDLALPDRSVDLVLFHQVLHFADDPLTAIRETARLLKAGGRVIIVDFAPHTQEFLRNEHAHRRLGFDDGEIKEWFDSVGLMSKPVRRLAGSELEVVIWTADKK
jgi:ArsR family transcriptional regulator